MSDLLKLLPRHKCGLFLTHNEHRDYYETIEEHTDDRDHWISPEQKAKAIEADEMWKIQWYPDTPIGFFTLWAADLEPLLAAAVALQNEDDMGKTNV